MRALVTGASGFIGSNICRGLLKRGFIVRAFHRPSSDLRLLDGLDVEMFAGDITSLPSLEKAMQGADVVFHCAAQLSNPLDLDKMKQVTVVGSHNLFQAALQNKIQRVVHTSSVAALGIPPQLPFGMPYLMDETHTWTPDANHWHYGYTKYLAELEVQKAVSQGLDVVIVNPSIVLGAGDLHQVSGNIVIYLAKHPLPIAVEGGANIVHIADVVDGHLAALNFGKTGERYILGGENLTFFDFLTKIAQMINCSPPTWNIPARLLRSFTSTYATLDKFLHLPINVSLLRFAGLYFYYNTQKAQTSLHLAPPRPIENAIQECYHWYLNQGVI